MTDTNEVNFADINWDNLKPEQYHELSERMINRMKAIKSNTPRERKTVNVRVQSKNYEIPESLFLKIKNAGNEQIKFELITQVTTKFKPLEEI